MGEFKLQTWHIIAIIIALALLTGVVTVKIGETPITPPGPGPGPEPTPTEMVIVTKTLKFVFLDKWMGSAPSGTGGYLYDTSLTQLEGASNAVSSGTWTTSNSYASDTKLRVKYVYDTTNDDVFWYEFTVPRMNPADAESLTTNTVNVKVFSLPTLTDDVKESAGGTSIADAGSWNKTSGGSPGTSIATCTYSWFVGTDGNGYLESHDPEYNMDLLAVVWVKVFNTNYENVILTGFDGAYEKGSAMYYYHVLAETEITKYKVGPNYIYSGAGAFAWTVDLSGYTGDDADMQIYLQVYSDPDYHKTYGSFGPYSVELAEQTVNLQD